MFDFVFGPNGSFYARAFGKTFSHNLPEALDFVISAPKQADSIYCVALGPDASFFVAYKDVKTGSLLVGSRNVSPKLNAWLYSDQANRVLSSKRHLPSMRVFFGKDKSYFAYDRKGYSCSHITTALVDFMESEVEARGSYYPTMVGIGTHGLFFVERADIKKWHVPSEHPKLKAYLDPDYAKESGQSGYYLEGKLQNFIIDPFTTPAQVIIQDQNGWLYDIPQLAQDSAASKVIENMNQHVLLAPPIPEPVPSKSPGSEAKDVRSKHSEKNQQDPNNQPPLQSEPRTRLKFPKRPTPIVPPSDSTTAKQDPFKGLHKLKSTRRERDPSPVLAPVTAMPEDKPANPTSTFGVPSDAPPWTITKPAQAPVIQEVRPGTFNVIQRKPSKLAPRVAVVEDPQETKKIEADPRIKSREDANIDALLKAQANSLQTIQDLLDELRARTSEFNRITKQIEIARARGQQSKDSSTLSPTTPASAPKQHHRSPSIRSLRDRLYDLRTTQADGPSSSPVSSERAASSKSPLSGSSRNPSNPLLQPYAPFRNIPMQNTSNLSLPETLSRSGSTTPIEPVSVSTPAMLPTIGLFPTTTNTTGGVTPITIPSILNTTDTQEPFIQHLQGLFGPASNTATPPQKEAMARLWELYGPEGQLRTALVGMTQAQMVVAMAWSLDMDVNQMYSLFGPALSDPAALSFLGSGGVGGTNALGMHAALAAGCSVM